MLWESNLFFWNIKMQANKQEGKKNIYMLLSEVGQGKQLDIDLAFQSE